MKRTLNEEAGVRIQQNAQQLDFGNNGKRKYIPWRPKNGEEFLELNAAAAAAANQPPYNSDAE
jgi:hypothetical protein